MEPEAPPPTKQKGEEEMANVIVDEMKCVEETDELGSDDVYLLTFRGSVPTDGGVTSNTQFTVLGPGSFWDEMDTGDRRTRDVVIAAYDRMSVYIVQLIERDNGRDVTAEAKSAYRSALDLAWTGALARTAGQSASQRVGVLANSITSALRALNSIYMEFPKGNDDWVGGPRRLSLPANNPQAVINFSGDGGRYRFNFKVA